MRHSAVVSAVLMTSISLSALASGTASVSGTDTGALRPTDARLELEPLLLASQSANPDLLAARLRSEAALQDVEARGILPDPRVFANAENDGFDPSLGSSNDSFIEIGWEQDVPAPGR